MLRLGGEVCLGEAQLHLDGSESSKTQVLGSPRRGFVRLGGSESLETQVLASPRRGFLRLGGDLRLGKRSYT